MRRRDLPKALIATGAGATLGPTSQAAVINAARHSATPSEVAARARIADDRYPPGDIRRYKDRADPDHTQAFQHALNVGGAVRVPQGKYTISAPVRLKAQGQMLTGEGPWISVIQYAGPPGGSVISVSDGKINYSNCAISNLTVDGNRLANIGIEAYDDHVGGGSWRTLIENVAVIGATHGADATAIRLGVGAWPNFAHDARIVGCYLEGGVYGVYGKGAKYSLSRCTLLRLSGAACRGLQGSAWSMSQCVFSANGWDFDGTNVQHVDCSGCWFEESRQGIYRATGAHSVSFVGCYLHTHNTDHMMDFGAAAGYHFIGGHFIPAATRSVQISNVSPAATGAVLGQAMSLKYAGTGSQAPLVLAPLQAGTGAVRSISAELTKGQTAVLMLGRGVFFLGADVRSVATPDLRSQASYTAFLFEGDDADVHLIAQRDGRAGAAPFSLRSAGNSVTLTNTGTETLRVLISGTGAAS
jgi:hypothetical protein